MNHRLTSIANRCIVLLVLSANFLLADWKEEIGFTRLQTLAGGDLPTSLPKGFSQVEASVTNPPPPYTFLPDTANPLFTGKLFTNKSSSSPTGISWHATHVATNLYGTSSLLSSTAAVPVDLYYAGDWLGGDFLKFGTDSAPATEFRAIQNHSWIDTLWTQAEIEEANQRLDYAIDRDGFVCVVGENNGTSTTLPSVLGQSHHTISAGRSDGQHSAGFTTDDGKDRIKPDIVAPSASPENATSWTTPMIGSAAGLLYAKLSASPYSLTRADLPRVIKALLLASARKDPSWSNTATRPLDLRYGAGVINIHHAYLALRAGRASYGSTQYGIRGWAAQSVGGTARTYYFTIPSGAPSTPFCAALTWHRVITDGSPGPNWSPSATPPANLSLHLCHATGTSIGSEITSSDSSVDNIELIYQATLAPGDYALQIQNASATTTTYGLAWSSLPSVTIAATQPTAREIDGQAGTVTLTRSGDTTLPMQVPLTIGGSAISGAHYQALPTTAVTIPAGQSSLALQVTPVSDSLAQGNRTVTVAVAADFALVRDAAQTAVVTIQDKPFDAWRFIAFSPAQLANPAISGETADPDRDQLYNLIEYGLGYTPLSPNAPPAAMIDSNGYLFISGPRNPDATDITWGAQTSGNLETWGNVAVTGTPTIFTATDNILSTAAERRFIRLKITRP